MTNEELNQKIAEVSKTIYRYCIARTPTCEEAEDLSQDILYELVRSAGNIRDDTAFYAFMWGVAGNVYKQWYRKRTRRQVSELTDDIPAEEESYSFDDDGEGDIYRLRRELALLSEQHRRATVLYYIHRKSCAEIAERLSISESMVKYLLFKSRKILKEGMNMERKLGTLSYDPKTLIPLFCGEGPNRFWDFMQSKIRQNIVSACYNDALTPQEISLETGISLSYLDDEIKALADKKILIADGPRYKTNVIIITADCRREIDAATEEARRRLAGGMAEFLQNRLTAYKEIGFAGNGFSDNTLRWQLIIPLFRAIEPFDEFDKLSIPETGWGDRACQWCVEATSVAPQYTFNFCELDNTRGDRVMFYDYLPKPYGDHHDFYGNRRYVNILCDIARGDCQKLSEYDLEAVADLIRLGYVRKEGDGFAVNMPIYTAEQYARVRGMAEDYVAGTLKPALDVLDTTVAAVLSQHTPKHLQEQVAAIAFTEKHTSAVSLPAQLLIEEGKLIPNWHAGEMPTTYIVLND